MSHEKFNVCVDADNDCASDCEHCATATNESNAAMLAHCIELNRYCADLCLTAAAFMARSNENTITYVNKFRPNPRKQKVTQG